MKCFVSAVLVIALFMVGTAVAVQPIPPQGETYTGTAAVEGIGDFKIKKKMLDDAIAIDVREWISGDTGPYGGFMMDSEELLNGDVNITDPKDPDYYYSKMILFSGDWIRGYASYGCSAFNGGMGASVTGNYNANEMQMQETVIIKSTSAVNQKQLLRYNTISEFNGTWTSTSLWRKPCKQNIRHTEMYEGEFTVKKERIFEELVVP
jgi:hypothetical protein